MYRTIPKFNTLSKEAKDLRAANKLEAMTFFAHKKLQELELEIEGVISSTISTDILLKSYDSQVKEIEVLNHIFELIENNY